MNSPQVVITVAIMFFVFWRKDTTLYIMAFPVLLASGLEWYANNGTPDGFIASLFIIGVAFYSLVLGIHNMLIKNKEKTKE